jgi:hypothetical protein
MITAKNGDKGLAFGNATLCSLPEIFYLWAADRGIEWHPRIRNLRQVIRQGNWASRVPTEAGP